jgi:hypothetical protein
MEVAYFTQREFISAGSLWEGDGVSVFHTYDAFIESGLRPVAIVVGFKDSMMSQKLLSQLRADKHYYLVPMFTEIKLGGAVELLSDGVARSPMAARRKLSQFSHLMSIYKFCIDNADIRLFLYLTTRGNSLISPASDWSSHGRYYYPLLRALSGKDEDQSEWLESLVERELLEVKHVIDKTRYCSCCQSANLNYVDVCPSCASGHITQPDLDGEKAAHSQRLCRDCHAHFAEAETAAYCLECKQLTPIKALTSKPVYSYVATQMGQEIFDTVSTAKDLAAALSQTAARQQLGSF